MKKGLHPEYNPIVFHDVSTGKRFITRSTLKTKKTEMIDGVEHQILGLDVTADSHPVFTGEKRFVDTAGRVEKFNAKSRRRR